MDVFIGTLHVGQACEQDRDRSSIALVTEIWNSVRGTLTPPGQPGPHTSLSYCFPSPSLRPKPPPSSPPVPLGAAPVGGGDGGTWRGAFGTLEEHSQCPWRGQGTATAEG